MLELKFGEAVFCDDIRPELNGKSILLGVFNGTLIVESLPTSLTIAAWIPIQPVTAGVGTVEFRIVGPNDALCLRGDGNAMSESLEPGAMQLRGLPLQIQSAGELALQLRMPGQDWVTSKRVMVRVATAEEVAMRRFPTDEANLSRLRTLN